MLIGFTDTAFAAPSTNIVSQIVQEFSTKTSNWSVGLQKYALVLLRWLLIIEVVLLGIKGAFSQDLKDTLVKFTMLVFFAGFMIALIKYYPEWSKSVLHGMQQIAGELGGVKANDSPFQVGLKIVGTIWDKMSAWSPAEALGLAIAGLIVLVCFAFITAKVVLIQCEAYVGLSAGIILLGFGGASFTKDIAIKFVFFAISIAFKLFVLQLVLGLGISFITSFETASSKFQDVFIVIGASIVLLALVQTLPELCANILNGASTSSGAGLGAIAAGAVGMGAGAVMGAMGAASAASSANKLADLQGKTGIGKLGSMAGSLWSANQEKQGAGSTTSGIMKERLSQAEINSK